MNIAKNSHDLSSDLPMAPNKQCPSGRKVKKLLLTHEPKGNYVISWRCLQMYKTLGVQGSKIQEL